VLIFASKQTRLLRWAFRLDKIFAFALAAELLITAAQTGWAAENQQARTVFPNSLKDLPPGLLLPGEPTADDAAATLDFMIALKMRGLDELRARIAIGAVIAPEEMAAKYYPLKSDYEALAEWMTKQGFEVSPADSSHLGIYASGSSAQAQKAFQCRLAKVKANGLVYTEGVTAPSLPAELAAPVLGINGLQPHIMPHKHIRTAARQVQPLIANAPPYLPKEILKAYNLNSLNLTGTGQTIGIVIDTFPNTSDLTNFWTAAGVNQSLSNVDLIQVVNGRLPSPSGEETLDTEWSSGIAVGAKVRVYAVLSLTFTHLDRGYAAIVSDLSSQPTLRQVSCSFGSYEGDVSNSQMNTDENYFISMVAGGVSVFVSSGDYGYDPDGTIQVETPANDPYVAGVGGTTLVLNTSNGSVSSETAWSGNYPSSGTGGGYSAFFSRPSWQTGMGVPSGNARLVPDIAAPADPDYGAMVVLNGSQNTVGGTSWGAPAWAGFCALFNQARATAGLNSIGLPGPVFYPMLLTSSFRDITSGNNGYSAGVGYDLCTGIGVPNLYALNQTLTAANITLQSGGGQSATVGTAVATPPDFIVQDNNNNPIAGVTVLFSANNGGSVTPASTTTSATGIASATSWTLGTMAGTNTLTATVSGTSITTQVTANGAAGQAMDLFFSAQPSGGAAGTAWNTQPAVTIQDAYGNTVTTNTSSVTLAIGTNPGGGTLSGTATVAAVNGVATFSGLFIDMAGNGYTLTASDGSFTGAACDPFNIAAGAAAQLAFTTQPSGGNVRVAWSVQPMVAVQDAYGNTVPTDTSNVTLTIGVNPGHGTLSGTLTVTAVGGLATFGGLSIDQVGTGYILAASDGSLTGATSNPFNITAGAPAQLAFTTQPGGGTAGTPWNSQPVVTVQDAYGNTVTTDTSAVILQLGANPSGGTLSGTVTVSAIAGVASFSGLYIDLAGNSYTLTAGDGSLTGATSDPFNITADAAAQLAFTTQPSGGAAGTAWSIQPAVIIKDAYGNTVTTNTSNVTLAIGTNPSGQTLSGTVTVSAIAGVASFSGLYINLAGNSYTLTAGDGSLTGATSDPFDITAGPAAQLAFIAQPSGGMAGAEWSAQPAVAVLDIYGNTVTTDTSEVTLSIGADPGGGTLSGTVTVSAVDGVATFSGLSINQAGIGYTLVAGDDALTSATSNAFNISAGISSKLAFTTQPGGGGVETAWNTQPVVTIQDTYGNTVTQDASSITLAIGTNLDGGTLSGIVTVAAVAGVATFSGLSIDQAGTGYTLAASDGELAGATSDPFNITSGAATRLVFTTQPGGGTAGTFWNNQPVAAIQDAYGNTVTSDTSEVTLTLGTNPGGGILSGTATATAVAGVATFTGLSINQAGLGYTLIANDGALAGAISRAFNITAGPVTQLLVAAAGGGAIGSQTADVPFDIQLTAEDAFGNLASGFNGTANLTSTGLLTAGGGTTPNFSGGLLASLPVTIGSSGNFTLTAALAGSGVTGTSDVFVVTLPAPGITGLAPVNGLAGGGTGVTISGANFAVGGTVAVIFGAAAAANVTVVNESTITCATPANPAGAVTVTVTNPDGQSAALPDGFTYVAQPNALPLSLGSLAGRVMFDLSGHDFCSFSGVLTSFPIIFSPAGAAVAVNVGGAEVSYVLNARGGSIKAASGAFTLKLSKKKTTGPNQAFTAKLANGAWAGVWTAEGLAPSSTLKKAALSMPVSVTIGGQLYSATAPIIYSGIAQRRGMFKLEHAKKERAE
jgi:subtilase family serine protease